MNIPLSIAKDRHTLVDRASVHAYLASYLACMVSSLSLGHAHEAFLPLRDLVGAAMFGPGLGWATGTGCDCPGAWLLVERRGPTDDMDGPHTE